MAGGKNLMSAQNPYIHSNYENFQAQYSWGAGIGGTDKKYRERLDREVKKLLDLRNKLRQETINFLGAEPKRTGLKLKDFMVQSLGANNFEAGFYVSVLQCLQSDGFYKLITDKIKGVTLSAAKVIFGENSKILKGIKEDTVDIIGMIMKNLSEMNFFELSGALQKEFLKNLVEEKFQKDINKIFIESAGKIRTETSRILRKRFRDAIIKVGEKDNTPFFNFIIGFLDSNLQNYLDKNLDEYSEEEYGKKYKELISAIQNNPELSLSIHKLYKQKIGELLGEDLIEVTFNEITTTPSSVNAIYNVTAVTTGGYSENLARRLVKAITSIKIFQGKAPKGSISKYTPGQLQGTQESDIKASVKDNTKMARSDLIITSPITKRTIGIQSKNYREKIITELGVQVNSSIALFSPHSNETIMEFVERLEGYNGNDIDTESLTYTLANMIWFATAGSIEKGSKSNPTQIKDPAMGEITAELSNFLVDLLGITYSQVTNGITYEVNQVLSEVSNIFYLINNEYMIPTYFIIEDLISAIKTDNKNIELQEPFVKLSLTSAHESFKAEAHQAIKLKEEKAKAVGGNLNSHKLYSDNALVEVGKSKGAEIAYSFSADNAFNLRKMYLNFDLNKLSAYNS